MKEKIVSLFLKELRVLHGQFSKVWSPHLKAAIAKWNNVLGKVSARVTEGVTERGLGMG